MGHEESPCSIPRFFGCSDEINVETRQRQGRKISYNRWHNNDEEVASYIVRHYHECKIASVPPSISLQESLSIPKQIHFIWFGPRPIPRYTDAHVFPQNKLKSRVQDGKYWNETSRSWKMYHTVEDGWSHKLWNEESMNCFHEEVEPSSESISTLRMAYRYALSIRNYGMASDIARLEILYVYGGLYVDFDYYCFRSMNDLHQSYDFYCGASNSGCIEVNNGLIGSKKHHFLLFELIKCISTWFSKYQQTTEIDERDLKFAAEFEPKSTPTSLMSSFLDDKSLLSLKLVQKDVSAMQVIENTGPGLLTKTIFELFFKYASDEVGTEDINLDGVIILPASAFHPFPNNHRQYIESKITDDASFAEIINKFVDFDSTRAVHLWSCLWQS